MQQLQDYNGQIKALHFCSYIWHHMNVTTNSQKLQHPVMRTPEGVVAAAAKKGSS